MEPVGCLHTSTKAEQAVEIKTSSSRSSVFFCKQFAEILDHFAKQSGTYDLCVLCA